MKAVFTLFKYISVNNSFSINLQSYFILNMNTFQNNLLNKSEFTLYIKDFITHWNGRKLYCIIFSKYYTKRPNF